MASPRFPEPPASITPTTVAATDALLARLVEKKDTWVKVSIPERIRLLEVIRDALIVEAGPWARTISRLKGIEPTDPLHGEDWLAAPTSSASLQP